MQRIRVRRGREGGISSRAEAQCLARHKRNGNRRLVLLIRPISRKLQYHPAYRILVELEHVRGCGQQDPDVRAHLRGERGGNAYMSATQVPQEQARLGFVTMRKVALFYSYFPHIDLHRWDLPRCRRMITLHDVIRSCHAQMRENARKKGPRLDRAS